MVSGVVAVEPVGVGGCKGGGGGYMPVSLLIDYLSPRPATALQTGHAKDMLAPTHGARRAHILSTHDSLISGRNSNTPRDSLNLVDDFCSNAAMAAPAARVRRSVIHRAAGSGRAGVPTGGSHCTCPASAQGGRGMEGYQGTLWGWGPPGVQWSSPFVSGMACEGSSASGHFVVQKNCGLKKM